MASNSFGTIIKCMTWGESHGKAMGVVIDGCPAGLELDVSDINAALERRTPGKSPYTSPRKEPDMAEILSGVYEGKTTGTPISIIIPNVDAQSDQYASLKEVLRPGHANFTYLEKYGLFDHRGGGRSSARETVGRVAASAVAKKILDRTGVKVVSYIKQIGEIVAESFPESEIYENPLYCSDAEATKNMMDLIIQAKEQGDSLGGVIEFAAFNLPVGLGDPVYEKIEANLAKAMLSIPASKGFEFGSGFSGASMRGSSHNDLFVKKDEKVGTKTNHAGGTLGGITTGMPLVGKVAFKPTSSIKKPQESLNLQGERSEFKLPSDARHDPCLAIRAVPIVEAMVILVIADAILLNRCAKI